MNTKQCPYCDLPLPLTEFGVVRARKDGMSLYCKKCVRIKVGLFRDALKAKNPVKRKPSVGPIQNTDGNQKPEQMIARAIYNGYHSRMEIKKVTRLGWDELTDRLAEMSFDEHLLVSRVVEGERKFYFNPRKAA